MRITKMNFEGMNSTQIHLCKGDPSFYLEIREIIRLEKQLSLMRKYGLIGHILAYFVKK